MAQDDKLKGITGSFHMKSVGEILQDMKAEKQQQQQHMPDLTCKETYDEHARLVVWIANNVTLYHQRRKFVVDNDNRDILRFMLYYFNDCPLAEDVFPGRGYKLHKHLLLQGKAGAGKTLLMQVFSDYLRATSNPRFFHNLSVTQMVNYYTLHNNLDRYTYNEEENKGFKCLPVNVCMNDLGVECAQFFGINTDTLTSEFLHARNEIWVNYHKMAHVTTNLSVEHLEHKYQDTFGRLTDRFKTYNVIPIQGESRR